MDPCDLMIKDCWQVLFQFLTAKDKQALCDTCTTFHDMLNPEKAKWGFELILPHIINEIDEFKSVGDSVLNCRLVCKPWKSAFDKYCENWENKGCYLKSHLASCYSFSRPHHFESFKRRFNDHPRNPFIGRHASFYASPSSLENNEVRNLAENRNNGAPIIEARIEEPIQIQGNHNHVDGFEDDDDDEDDEDFEVRARQLRAEMRQRNIRYREMLLEFLPKYGEEIHGLRLNSFDGCTKLDFSKFVQWILSNTSKLRGFYSRRSHMDDDAAADVTFEKELAEYYQSNPLPKMCHLRYLDLLGWNWPMEKPLLDAYGKNLFSLFTSNGDKLSTTLWGSMTNLKKLELDNANFNMIEKILKAIQSPLQTLFVSAAFDEGGPQAGPRSVFFIDRFLLAVQNLPLKTIVIEPDSMILTESVPFTKDFPMNLTIQEFTIDFAESISINFLKYLPTLRTFQLTNSDRCKISYSALLQK